MEEVVNLAALEGSVDFSMMGMFLKSDWVVKFVIILLVIFLLYLDVRVTLTLFIILAMLLGIITLVMARQGNVLGDARALIEKKRISLVNHFLNNSNEIRLYQRVYFFKEQLLESTRNVSNVEAFQFFLSTLPKVFLEVVGIILLFITFYYILLL